MTDLGDASACSSLRGDLNLLNLFVKAGLPLHTSKGHFKSNNLGTMDCFLIYRDGSHQLQRMRQAGCACIASQHWKP